MGVVVLTIFFVLRNKDTTALESERVAVLNSVLRLNLDNIFKRIVPSWS